MDNNKNETKKEEYLKNEIKESPLKKFENEKNQIIEDINNSLIKLGINCEDNEIETNHIIYIRDNPIYTEINGYIVGEQLGKGMFSVVTEFVHKKSLKRFAAKIMNTESIARRGQTYLDGIKTEVNFVNKFNHKNVIKIIDFFSIDVNYYLILEYCYAVLEEFLKHNQNLPESQSHLYFCQMIEGLDYLHSIGVIHRDIKPANLLITPYNEIKITDFGSSKVLNTFCKSDEIKGKVGTPLYTPPEVYLNYKTGYSGTKYDIWSSGVTLYQMISGSLPFNNIPSITKGRVKYSEPFLKNILLLNLLKRIFIKDYKKRIRIENIRKHPWLIIKYSENDFVRPPPKTNGDIYRTLTVLPYIHYHYYCDTSSNEEELVSEKEFKESKLLSVNS